MVVLQTANRYITGLVLAADRDALGFMLDSCFILTISALAVLITILSVRHLHVKLTFLKLSDPSVHLMGSLWMHTGAPSTEVILQRCTQLIGYLGEHLVATDIFIEPLQHKPVISSVFTICTTFFFIQPSQPLRRCWSIIILVRSSGRILYSTVLINTGQPAV